ncbi:MAG: hybrid sensor histidine kinase/response regulator [Caldilineaceae bacterium]|nr:hybrid sensor histidine kinase/response regulator [Caldilineaceae bacterium]
MPHTTTFKLEQDARRFGENWAIDRSESAKWVAVGLIAFALLLVWLGDGESSAAARIPLFLTGLVSIPCALGIWLLSQWRPRLALPLSGVLFATLLSVGAHWLQIPGLLLVAGIPVVHLALAGQGGVAALLAVALGIALWTDNGSLQSVDKVLSIAGLVALWLIGARARYSMTSRVTWAWQHYNLAQQKLEDARDRNQALDTVLEQQVHTNRQLDLLNERLAALRARAEENQRTKAAFVAKVSHEFRTPLNMIIGLVDLLIEAPHVYGERLPNRLLEDLRIVHRNCEHLSGMINDVLDLSQTEAGRLTLHREVGDLCADIHHAVQIVYPLVEKKGLTLNLELPDAAVLCLRDQTRIRQVLLNLLSNAARYTSRGMITVRLLHQTRHIRIEIADTGPGINADDLERIFEPFFQSGNLEGLSQTGTGLGLSISKQFVEMHGGQLGVESQRGEGSTFWLSLPILPPDDPAHKADRWIHEDWAWHERQNRVELPNVSRRRRVILLDVNDGIHPLLDEQTEQLELISKSTVAEVTQDATTTPAHGVLVNGPTPETILTVMDEIRRRVPDTPVLGWAVPTPSNRAHAAGALEYLVKPVTRADLIGVLALVPAPVKRILVVDDDIDVQRLLTRILNAHDAAIQVDTATDVESALALLHTSPPDLMLLDLALDRGTGWDLLARKRQHPALAAIPAVILSAQDPMEQSLHSPYLVASMGTGLPLATLQGGSLALMEILLNGSTEPDPIAE